MRGKEIVLTTIAYVIVVICVLLTIIGMAWYVLLTKKAEKEKEEELQNAEKGETDNGR